MGNNLRYKADYERNPLWLSHWFSAYPLIRDTMWVKYAEPDGSIREDMLPTRNLENWFKVTIHSLLKRSIYRKYELNRAMWTVYKKDFCVNRHDPDSWPSNFVQGHCTPFNHRHSVSEVWARLDQGEIRYAPDTDFTYNPAMTLTLDLP